MSVSCRWFSRWSDDHNHRYLELSGGAILDTRNLQALQRLTRMFGHHPNIVFNIIMHHHSHKSKWLTMIMNSYLDNAVSTTVADCHIDWLQLRKNNIRYDEGKAILKGLRWWSLYEIRFIYYRAQSLAWGRKYPGNQFQFSPIEPVVVKTILNFLLSCISQFSWFYQPCIRWK